MISLYEGRIGGGKTYLAVTRILAHLAKGGTVYTNVELNLDGCEKYLRKHYGVEMDRSCVVELDEQQTWDFHRHLRQGEPDLPTLAVVDEAHLWFNARDHAITAATRRGLLTFMSQSRKLCVDVILIVQAIENLDAQFRRLAQEVWRMKDMSKLRLPLIGIQYPWPHTFVFRMDAGAKQIMERKILRRSKDIFECYNTNALLRPVEFAGEIAKKKNLAKKERFSWWQVKIPLDVYLWAVLVLGFLLKVRHG